MDDVKISYRWVILGLITFCIFVYGMIFQSIPPILSILINTLHLSYAQAGALMSLFTIPKILISLPGGILVDRYGSRIVGIVSLVMMILGTGIVSLGNHYWVLMVGRFIGGMGTAGIVVMGAKAVTSWFYKLEIGFSMGVFNLSMPLATVLSLNLMGLIAYRFHWRVSILICLAMGAIALCLFLGLFRNREMNEQKREDFSGWLVRAKKAGWGIWCVGISWGLFNAGLFSFLTFAPDYFFSKGMNVTKAGLISSYPMWGAILLAPLVGILIDRVGRKWLFVAIGCGGMSLLLYCMALFPTRAPLFAILIGVFVAIVTPAIFSLPAELLPESVMGFGFGIHGTSLGIGISLGPYVVGSLRDVTGDYLFSFAAMATFTALGIIPMWILRNKGKV
jgi:predicted MFS family arabinose efflux permease